MSHENDEPRLPDVEPGPPPRPRAAAVARSAAPAVLCGFRAIRPTYEASQEASVRWLAAALARADATRTGGDPTLDPARAASLERLIARYGCGPDRIARRASVLEDFVHTRWEDMRVFRLAESPAGAGLDTRTAVFDEAAGAAFEAFYPAGEAPPDEIVHVTCTGYVSPSGAQRLVSRRGWGARTTVTHAYHMGCYAAIPALRMAAGALAAAAASPALGARDRVDVVHTELCTLHLEAGSRSPEQLVIQSLFADGLIRYSAAPATRLAADEAGLEVVALREEVVAGSLEDMTWRTGATSLRMTLAREVPDRVADALPAYLGRLFAQAGLDFEAERRAATFAVHPGGPRIIDRVAERLALADAQVEASRAVLRDRGNMSSATLPHVWQRLLEPGRVAPGALVASLAFGPGLTVAGALFRKVDGPCRPS